MIHFSRCHFQKNSDLRLCHIWIINTNTDSKPNWPGISLHLPENNLENTWNFVSPESGKEHCVLTHFEIFITKICMKVPGIWSKNLWKNLEFRTKNLEKTWNLVFGKKWEPWIVTKQCNKTMLQHDYVIYLTVLTKQSCVVNYLFFCLFYSSICQLCIGQKLWLCNGICNFSNIFSIKNYYF